MTRSHRYPAVRAHLLDLQGDADAAKELYLAAAKLTTNTSEQRYLRNRASAWSCVGVMRARVAWDRGRMGELMDAWAVERPGPIDDGPLRRVRRTVPQAGPGEVLVKVEVCGVCRTDLHLCEGDLEPRRPGVVPGHQVVGAVVDRGPQADRFEIGDRIGDRVAAAHLWGSAKFCRAGSENLCPLSSYTGWDADGGFAEYAVVPAGLRVRAAGRLSRGGSSRRSCAPGSSATGHSLRANLPPGGRLGDLRVRLQRPPHRPDRDRPGRRAVRHDARRTESGAGPLPGCRVRRGDRRPTARATGLGDRVRSGRRRGPVRPRSAQARAELWRSPGST